MLISADSAWPRADVEGFLDAYRAPLRLAATETSGFPRICSLWFRRDGDRLVCATQADAWVARALSRDDRCGFELAPNEPPYRGVRGIARARIEAEGAREELERLIDRYLASRETRLARWLLSRADREVKITLEIERVTAWDYRERMSD